LRAHDPRPFHHRRATGDSPVNRLSVILPALLLAACNDRDNMRQGARLKPFEASPGQPGLLATNSPPPGTVPRDTSPFEPVPRPPPPLTPPDHGRERFDIHCAPCHARDGYGDGIIARHGFPRPPSFHDADIRARDDSHYYSVITNGLGKMPPYGTLVR